MKNRDFLWRSSLHNFTSLQEQGKIGMEIVLLVVYLLVCHKEEKRKKKKRSRGVWNPIKTQERTNRA